MAKDRPFILTTRYCTGCLKTQKFIEDEDYLVCPMCGKKYKKVK